MVWCKGLFFLAAISTAYGLTCYKCDSSESGICNHGLVSLLYDTEDCDKDSSILGSIWTKECVKLIAKNEKGDEYVARGCMPRSGGACKVVAQTLNFFSKVDGGLQDIQCHTCNTDKCNSADKFTGLGVLAAALVAMVAFLF